MFTGLVREVGTVVSFEDGRLRVGRIRAVEAEGAGKRVWVDAPPELLPYCVEKGSIAVDGVSLTVSGLDDDGFAVALVPHTLEATTLGEAASGDE
jgi:riboflavin synthase